MGRWCHHHRELGVLKGGSYSNAGGEQRFGRKWSPQLRLVARLAWLLESMVSADGAALETMTQERESNISCVNFDQCASVRT